MSDTPLFTLSVKSRIAALNDNPMFLPWETISSTLLPIIATVAVSLSVLYVIMLSVVQSLSPPKTDRKKVRKVAYQMTNMCVNFFLSTVGLYTYVYILPAKATLEEQIEGFQDIYFLSCFQIGYQIWALPVGILYVPETIPMLIHHATVAVVASLSCFMTNGFRYWTPFFYGVLEISSVPLAIMNTFKDNPEWISTYPQTYLTVRLAFSITFFFFRVYLYIPHKLRFLRDEFLLFATNPLILYKLYMTFVWICSFTIWSLQLFWATLIIKGFANTLLRRKKKKKGDDTNGVKQE